MSEPRMISITIEDEILVGCYDLLATFGGDPEEPTPEKVVSGILKALVLGIQDDKLIPTYDSPNELQSRIELLLPQTETDEQIMRIAEKLTANLKDSSAFEALDKKLKEPDLAEMNEDVSLEPAPARELTFAELPKDDDLVKEVKGSLSKQTALCQIYSRLPRDQWGSEKSRQMYQMILDNSSDKPK